MRVNILKSFLSPVYSMIQIRQYDTIPRPDGNSVTGYFYYLSVEHGITTFVYSHICVRVVPYYQINLNRGDFL